MQRYRQGSAFACGTSSSYWAFNIVLKFKKIAFRLYAQCRRACAFFPHRCDRVLFVTGRKKHWGYVSD